MIIKIYNLQLNYKNESYFKRYYVTYFYLLVFQIIKNKTRRFQNPGKPFGFALTPETMEKYNGPAQPKKYFEPKTFIIEDTPTDNEKN